MSVLCLVPMLPDLGPTCPGWLVLRRGELEVTEVRGLTSWRPWAQLTRAQIPDGEFGEGKAEGGGSQKMRNQEASLCEALSQGPV